MLSIIQKLIILTEKRIPFLMKHGDGNFFKGSQTFFDGILDEMNEVKEELENGKQVYLEDELGDVFWDYICLLENLEQEGKINKEKVFERCYTKFSERLNIDGSNNGNWIEVKRMQKERLKQEQDTLDNIL
ncbi:MAG: MazG nucleotide pyrophosphohydrolase domain-containing protein [Candidatus Gracilibacteria bacterium]|nr:MazG nucleotide pyrophosphohydrolase domain-containing protein [Candidatus Gracilibacteria bacterium]